VAATSKGILAGVIRLEKPVEAAALGLALEFIFGAMS